MYDGIIDFPTQPGGLLPREQEWVSIQPTIVEDSKPDMVEIPLVVGDEPLLSNEEAKMPFYIDRSGCFEDNNFPVCRNRFNQTIQQQRPVIPPQLPVNNSGFFTYKEGIDDNGNKEWELILGPSEEKGAHLIGKCEQASDMFKWIPPQHSQNVMQTMSMQPRPLTQEYNRQLMNRPVYNYTRQVPPVYSNKSGFYNNSIPKNTPTINGIPMIIYENYNPSVSDILKMVDDELESYGFKVKPRRHNLLLKEVEYYKDTKEVISETILRDDTGKEENIIEDPMEKNIRSVAQTYKDLNELKESDNRIFEELSRYNKKKANEFYSKIGSHDIYDARAVYMNEIFAYRANDPLIELKPVLCRVGQILTRDIKPRDWKKEELEELLNNEYEFLDIEFSDSISNEKELIRKELDKNTDPNKISKIIMDLNKPKSDNTESENKTFCRIFMKGVVEDFDKWWGTDEKSKRNRRIAQLLTYKMIMEPKRLANRTMMTAMGNGIESKPRQNILGIVYNTMLTKYPVDKTDEQGHLSVSEAICRIEDSLEFYSEQKKMRDLSRRYSRSGFNKAMSQFNAIGLCSSTSTQPSLSESFIDTEEYNNKRQRYIESIYKKINKGTIA